MKRLLRILLLLLLVGGGGLWLVAAIHTGTTKPWSACSRLQAVCEKANAGLNVNVAGQCVLGRMMVQDQGERGCEKVLRAMGKM